MNSRKFGEIVKTIREAQSKGYPESIEIKVVQDEKLVLKISFGPRYKYFDLASLTKILVTTPLIIRLVQSKRLDLQRPVKNYLKEFDGTEVGEIKIKNLLRHCSGLVAHRFYNKKLVRVPLRKRKAALKNLIAREKVNPVRKAIYSDLDFFILGWIVEEIFGRNLDKIATREIFDPLRLKTLTFKPRNKAHCAKGALKTPRGSIRGVVDDDNCWSLGGVSGHAGLFGNADDVSRIGEEFLKIYNGQKSKWLKTPTLRKFANRATSKKLGDFGLGFWVPSKPSSTGGRLISKNAFGHPGWTGTSLWVDPKRNAVVTVLANRTYPRRFDYRFRKLRVKLHDLIWELLDG